MVKHIQFVTATNSEEEAKKISQVVVEKRLAGCAQVIGPILSTYWWKGEIEES